jgi:hypothetical protein
MGTEHKLRAAWSGIGTGLLQSVCLARGSCLADKALQLVLAPRE